VPEDQLGTSVWQAKLTSALDRLGRCTGDDDRWACGIDLLRDCGSQWITAGTAPLGRMADVAVRSNTPASLMHDYLGEGLDRKDPWMRLCAESTRFDILDTRTPVAEPLAERTRMARLFSDHGVRRAVLVPCYGGRRSGGIVLYDCNAASDRWVDDPAGLEYARMIVAVFSAMYRPEGDRSESAELFRFRAALTPREREVLGWLCSGLRTDRIADRMAIEPVTVSKHLASIRRKLGAKTREQAVALAMLDGLVAV
jgi:DNA-binding CsgD family transcriptional regulator